MKTWPPEGIKPYYYDDSVCIIHGDCREFLPKIEQATLVLTDPPYCGVVAESWDNQWKSEDDFLIWMESVVVLICGSMHDNAGCYVFASPQMAARVEVLVSKYMRILNHAIWDKGDERKGSGGSGVDVTALRCYWSANTERVIFAEKYGMDENAKMESGYWTKCESVKRSVIGDYLKSEFEAAKVSNREIAALFPSKTGGMTGCVSNWILGLNVPTAEQYQKIREYLNRNGEYAYLRREYEDLRRPFFLTASMQWGDLWRFPIERRREHQTQKPLSLISQLCLVSSRKGDTIIDPFMGSGTTLRAAKDLNRKAIGIEIEEKYCEISAMRMQQEVLPL
jgi:adenine-specific DNA-methyltransferase